MLALTDGPTWFTVGSWHHIVLRLRVTHSPLLGVCCCVCAPFILFTCNFTPQHDTIVQLSSSSLLHNDTPPHSHTHTHPRALVPFRRRRRPLAVCARTQVTLAEALTGFTRPISLVDGRTVLFKTRDGEIVSPGAVRKLPVSGM